MSRVIILMYHIIDNVLAPNEEKYCCTPAHFEKQMRFLQTSKYVPVSLDQFVNSLDGKESCPDNSVVVTFDDGFDNMFDKALPILQKYNIPSTVFILPDRINNTNDWMHTRGFPQRRLLSKPQLHKLNDAGVCIGSHTRTHARLTDISKDRIEDEIGSSKKILEDILGTEVAYFAYPFGLYNEHAHAVVEQAGYRAACSTRSGFNRCTIDRFALRRIEIYGSDSIRNFQRKLKYGANDVTALYPLQYYSSRLAVKLGLKRD